MLQKLGYFAGIFCHGTSIVAKCCQFVDGTKPTIHATVDFRPTTLASVQHRASTAVYSTTSMRQRVARVHLRHLIRDSWHKDQFLRVFALRYSDQDEIQQSGAFHTDAHSRAHYTNDHVAFYRAIVVVFFVMVVFLCNVIVAPLHTVRFGPYRQHYT